MFKYLIQLELIFCERIILKVIQYSGYYLLNNQPFLIDYKYHVTIHYILRCNWIYFSTSVVLVYLFTHQDQTIPLMCLLYMVMSAGARVLSLVFSTLKKYPGCTFVLMAYSLFPDWLFFLYWFLHIIITYVNIQIICTIQLYTTYKLYVIYNYIQCAIIVFLLGTKIICYSMCDTPFQDICRILFFPYM